MRNSTQTNSIRKLLEDSSICANSNSRDLFVVMGFIDGQGNDCLTRLVEADNIGAATVEFKEWLKVEQEWNGDDENMIYVESIVCLREAFEHRINPSNLISFDDDNIKSAADVIAQNKGQNLGCKITDFADAVKNNINYKTDVRVMSLALLKQAEHCLVSIDSSHPTVISDLLGCVFGQLTLAASGETHQVSIESNGMSDPFYTGGGAARYNVICTFQFAELKIGITGALVIWNEYELYNIESYGNLQINDLCVHDWLESNIDEDSNNTYFELLEVLKEFMITCIIKYEDNISQPSIGVRPETMAMLVEDLLD